jgi:hypothetical protein
MFDSMFNFNEIVILDKGIQNQERRVQIEDFWPGQLVQVMDEDDDLFVVSLFRLSKA